MKSFIGNKEYRMDDKGRVALLPQWRKFLSDRVYLTIGLNNSLWGYTPEEWERLTDEIAKNPLPDDDTLNLSIGLASDAFEAEIDKQGRVSIPQQVREELQLGEEVVVAGVFGHFEIRNRADWGPVKAAARAAARAAANAKHQASIKVRE